MLMLTGLNDYDFIDFGCSKGGSIAYAAKAFGVPRGIGIDISPEKVEATRGAGFDAMLADARTLSAYPKAVSFVTMLDFLEHLPGLSDARTCILSASEVAKDFIFIRQPWFDSDGYLMSLGLKLYWSDWRGHPNAMTSLEFHNVLSRIPNIEDFRIYGRDPILDSDHPAVHPIGSPTDQHEWKAGTHDPKPAVPFDRPVFKQIMCIAILKGSSTTLEEVEAKLPWDTVVFASDA
ncbi:class I SAM-dependent methyltransferase [Aminobacter ciceronei]|uniref:SAM-dependent methyltransferase n=1 Tax=Aminobacter ciceronei TaxID=150723 RepID=A0ABR6CHX3_9HYPH|nr:class I SAM-dependent methyltransferase [Aminobacter ciceronei]MBA8906827.1 SAM-dependent methyltransferase [Aminobacter ciceronei]MBA9024634.1 SAM-dependent methyltransferase [Aminobacter ciceronei]